MPYLDQGVEAPQGVVMPKKHTVSDPANSTGFIYGTQTTPGLFSYAVNDIISDVTRASSIFLQWLPARGIKDWNYNIAHYSWEAPEDFDGSDSYFDHLAAQEAIGTCEFGEGAQFNICEYTMGLNRMTKSNKNNPLVYPDHFGMRQTQNQPRYMLRGSEMGSPIDNDAIHQTAMVAGVYEEHVNWNAIYGDSAVASGDGMIDGIDKILSIGWVKANQVGSGSCDYTDPYVINGIPLNTPELVANMIYNVISQQIAAMASRGYIPSGDDMAIMMSPVLWTRISDSIAAGALADAISLTGVIVNTTPEVIQRERERLQSGGLGFGFFPVGNHLIPIIPETRMGQTVPISAGVTATTGDILIMTKNFRGIRLLEYQYLDYRLLDTAPTEVEADFLSANGSIYNGWVVDNKKCVYLGMEGYGRIVTAMQPFQARINGVTLTDHIENENESGSWGSPNYYPYGRGNRGSEGDAYLEGIS